MEHVKLGVEFFSESCSQLNRGLTCRESSRLRPEWTGTEDPLGPDGIFHAFSGGLAEAVIMAYLLLTATCPIRVLLCEDAL